MKKHKWLFQVAAVIALYILLIFTCNRLAAQKESYKIVGMGVTLNEMALLIPVTTSAVFTIDEETDIVGVEVNERIAYKYLLTKPIGAENKLEFKSATFAAVDPENHKYIINMRIYTSGEMQITVADSAATAAYVFFIQTQAVDGMTAANK